MWIGGRAAAVMLSDVPAWLTGLILAILFPLAVEAGFRLHGMFSRRGPDEDSESGAGYIVSAALALLGLLIAFTFSMSANRFEARRHLVVEEANAISTVWLRQQLLAEPERSRLAGLMRDYVKERRAFVAAGSDRARLDANWASTGALQQRIWTETGAALRAPTAAPLTTAVLQATNDMFDLAASQRAALDAHVPPAILQALILYAAASAGVMGYGLSTGARRHLVASTTLFVLVALTIALIIDLDQPHRGGIRVLQTPLDRTAADILRTPAPS
jgi:hypothetical protein